MLKECLSIASFFSEGAVVSDEIAGKDFIALPINEAAEVLLEKVGDDWTYLSAASADHTLLNSWATDNGLSLPTTSQLTQHVNYEGNLFLTAGELAKIIVHMSLYGRYISNADSTDADDIDSGYTVNGEAYISTLDVPEKPAEYNFFSHGGGLFPSAKHTKMGAHPTGSAPGATLWSGRDYGYCNFDGDFTINGEQPDIIMVDENQLNINGITRDGGYSEFKPEYATRAFTIDGGGQVYALDLHLSDGSTRSLFRIDEAMNDNIDDGLKRTCFVRGVAIKVNFENDVANPGHMKVTFGCRIKMLTFYVDRSNHIVLPSSVQGIGHIVNHPEWIARDYTWNDVTVDYDDVNHKAWITYTDMLTFNDGNNGGGSCRNMRVDLARSNVGFSRVDSPSTIYRDPYVYPNSSAYDESNMIFNLIPNIAYDTLQAAWSEYTFERQLTTVAGNAGAISLDMGSTAITPEHPTATQLVPINSRLLMTNTGIQAYKHVQAIDWNADVQSATLPRVVQYGSAIIRMSMVIREINTSWDERYTAAQAAIVGTQVQIINLGKPGNVTESYTKTYSTSTLFNNAVSAIDVFQSINVIESPINDALKHIIATRYSVMDAYLAMYADYTANLVVADVLDSLTTSLVSGMPMEPTFGVTDTTELKIEYDDTTVYTFTAAELRAEGRTKRVSDITNTISKLSHSIQYALTLFIEAHDAFGQGNSLDTFRNNIQQKLDRIKLNAVTIASTKSVYGNALLLNVCEQEGIYSRVEAALSNAVTAGYTTLSDVINYLSKIAPEFGYYITKTNEKALYESILGYTPYAEYKVNILNAPYELKSSNVSYWGTYINRMGSSLLGSASPDAEFIVNSDGALYIYPPIISVRIDSAQFRDAMINAGNVFVAPFAASYAMFSYISGNIYELNWCARFNGGNDADLIDAIKNSWNEFFNITTEIARAYVGDDPDFVVSWPEIEVTGYQDKTVLNEVTGALAVIGIGALSSLLGTDWSGFGTGGVKASLPGIAMGTSLSAILATAGVIWDDTNGEANESYSVAAVVSSTNKPEFINKITIENGPWESEDKGAPTGMEAVNALVQCLMWALRHGFIAPVGDYDPDGVNTIGYGVLCPSIPAPKFTYVGERTDYSALAITAAIGITAGYTRRYMRYEKVRTVSYLPTTTAIAAGSVAGDVISEVMSEDAASESQLADLADIVANDESVGDSAATLYDMVKACATLIGVNFAEDGSIDTNMPINPATLLGVVGSIASIASIIDGTTDKTLSIVEDLNSRYRVYRY